MMPAFVVRSVNGDVRAYDDAGRRIDLSERAVEAWSDQAFSDAVGVQVICIRQEPLQVEWVVIANQLDRDARARIA